MLYYSIVHYSIVVAEGLESQSTQVRRPNAHMPREQKEGAARERERERVGERVGESERERVRDCITHMPTPGLRYKIPIFLDPAPGKS